MKKYICPCCEKELIRLEPFETGIYDFWLKKHMTKIENLKWDYFNGDLDKPLKGE